MSDVNWADLTAWQHCVLVGALEGAALFDLPSIWRPGSDTDLEPTRQWAAELGRAVVATAAAGLIVAVGQLPGEGEPGWDLTLDELREAVEQTANWFGPLELLVSLYVTDEGRRVLETSGVSRYDFRTWPG